MLPLMILTPGLAVLVLAVGLYLLPLSLTVSGAGSGRRWRDLRWRGRVVHSWEID